MKKSLLKLLLLAIFATIMISAKQAKAGHDLGVMSKKNPCIYSRFTLAEDDYFGGFFKISGNAKNVKMTVVNLSKGDVSFKVNFVDINDKWEVIKTLTFKLGKKKSTFNLPDLGNNQQYFIEVQKPNFNGLKTMDIGISVYSESFCGKAHDFTKIALSKNELTLKNGQTVTLKATVAKSLKDKSVIWSTSDKNVATVSKKGKVKAVGGGSAIITCTSKKNKNITAQCFVWVEGETNPGNIINDNPDIKQSGDINNVELTEEPFNLDTAHRYLTLKTNDYSGPLTLEFICTNGTDTQTITVEKNKTYTIDYEYSFVNRDDNWQSYLGSIGGSLSFNTVALSVAVKGTDAYSGYRKLTANTFNIGTLKVYES